MSALDRLKRDARTGALLNALREIAEALAGAEKRMPVEPSGGVVLQLLPDGSGCVEAENWCLPIDGSASMEAHRIFTFNSRRELVRWLVASDAERAALEARAYEKEREDFAKLDLLAASAGGVQ